MVVQFGLLRDVVILSGAVLQTQRRACPERSRRDFPLHQPRAWAKMHRYAGWRYPANHL